MDRPDRASDLLRGGALQEVAAGAGAERAEDALLGVVRGEHDDARARGDGGEAGDRVDAVDVREFEVEEDDIGPAASGRGDRRLGGSDGLRDLKIALVLEDRDEAFADYGMVVDDENADHVGRVGERGRTR